MSVTNAWVGAVTDSTARVVAKVTDASVQLAVAPQTDPTNWAFYAPVTPTAEDIADLTATGLTPDTAYKWAIQGAAFEDLGTFRTHVPAGQPMSYTFAAYSCAGLQPAFPGVAGTELDPQRVSNHPAFDTIRNRNPLFTICDGDLHYYNFGGGTYAATLANYRHSYDDVLAQPRQSLLYRNSPIVYTYDDHDFGLNNSDRTAPGREMAAQAYRERVPSYPLVEASGSIYHAFTVGRVLFIVSDSRYDRDPDSDPASAAKTMLGTAQKAWLDNLLATSGAQALIWVMSSMWMGQTGDSWHAYQHERDEVAQMFADHGWTGRMCVISGDMHALAIDTGANNLWGGFPVLQFAAVDSPYVGGASTDLYDLGGSGGRDRYGTVRVVDHGGTIAVRGAGWIGSDLWKSHTWFSRQPVTVLPLSLDYAAGRISPPFEPTEDDQQLRNDVTVERIGGSSARAVQQTGPLSTQDPPDGVGRYDSQARLNLADDDQLPDQASWRVHLGTVDEPRYPEVTVDLTRPGNRDVMGDVAAVEAGDRMTIRNVPPWLPPGDIDLLVEGYTETFDQVAWRWTANTSPADPWTVAVAGDVEVGRLDTGGSTFNTAIDDAETTFDQASDGAPWIDSAAFPDQFPFRVEAGGEEMLVTGITDDTSPQTFTVQRGVNGVTRSHPAGERISLAQQAVIAL